MNLIDKLAELPIDLFINQITYLPFRDVINICSNKELELYCSDEKYNNHWKRLIDNTFSNIYNYQEKLKLIQTELGITGYNYLVYVNLIRLSDPITQLMIYYRQGDMESFNDIKFNKTQQFLALFLLKKKNIIMDYLPNENYLPFIDILNGIEISQKDKNKMTVEMAMNGNMRGLLLTISMGGNKHYDYALIRAAKNGHFEIVRYLIENGANIHAADDYVLKTAASNGHLEIVEYLVEKGVNIHAEDDYALRWAAKNNHLAVVKYLVRKGADIYASGEEALQNAIDNKHTEVIDYLRPLY